MCPGGSSNLEQQVARSKWPFSKWPEAANGLEKQVAYSSMWPGESSGQE